MASETEYNSELNIEINLKGIFESGNKEDGFRILIDRPWPRGLKKSEAGVDLWLREIAPSAELRKWFNHEPQRWDEFVADYNFQLKRNEKIIAQIKGLIKMHKKVSLIYVENDEKYNHAFILKSYLDKLFCLENK